MESLGVYKTETSILHDRRCDMSIYIWYQYHALKQSAQKLPRPPRAAAAAIDWSAAINNVVRHISVAAWSAGQLTGSPDFARRPRLESHPLTFGVDHRRRGRQQPVNHATPSMNPIRMFYDGTSNFQLWHSLKPRGRRNLRLALTQYAS